MEIPRPEDIGKRISDSITVDHILLTRAKDAVLHLVAECGVTAGHELVNEVVRQLGARDPGPMPWHRTLPFQWEQITPHVEFFSAMLAACEAIWQLIHNGLLIPGYNATAQPWEPAFNTSIPNGYSGSTSHTPIRGFQTAYPTQVLLAPSTRTRACRSLADGDLFIRDVGVASLHPLIDESLREAVRCFRHELYLPCMAMLAKAVEGAWTEMGVALADYGIRAQDTGGPGLRKKLEDPLTGLEWRIDKVAEFYRKATSDPVEKKSGTRRMAVDQAATWSHEVRDSRNVLHFGKMPAVPISYERVAVFMIATTTHLRAMYAVKDAANSLP